MTPLTIHLYSFEEIDAMRQYIDAMTRPSENPRWR